MLVEYSCPRVKEVVLGVFHIRGYVIANLPNYCQCEGKKMVRIVAILFLFIVGTAMAEDALIKSGDCRWEYSFTRNEM